MRRLLKRVATTALVAATLETSAAVIRSHSFHLLPVAIFAIIEFLFFFLVVNIAALVSTRVISVAPWVQKTVFFVVTVTPSLLSYFSFYRGVSYYEQGGSLLVSDNRMTIAGAESLALSICISAVVALIATTIYFRAVREVS